MTNLISVYEKSEEKRPQAGSLSDIRGRKASARIMKEILELCDVNIRTAHPAATSPISSASRSVTSSTSTSTSTTSSSASCCAPASRSSSTSRASASFRWASGFHVLSTHLLFFFHLWIRDLALYLYLIRVGLCYTAI